MIQYAVQQTAHSAWINEYDLPQSHSVCSRLLAFDRAHAEAMAAALKGVCGEEKLSSKIHDEYRVRHTTITTYQYSVVGMIRSAKGSATWLEVSDLEMIASMFTEK